MEEKLNEILERLDVIEKKQDILAMHVLGVTGDYLKKSIFNFKRNPKKKPENTKKIEKPGL